MRLRNLIQLPFPRYTIFFCITFNKHAVSFLSVIGPRNGWQGHTLPQTFGAVRQGSMPTVPSQHIGGRWRRKEKWTTAAVECQGIGGQVLDIVLTSANILEAMNGMICGWLRDKAATVSKACMETENGSKCDWAAKAGCFVGVHFCFQPHPLGVIPTTVPALPS